MGISIDDLFSLGDPAGMRRLAAEFSTRAEAVAATIESLSLRVAATTFEGPAATQLRAAMRAREERGRQAVLRLEAAAATLRRAAGRVEDEIDEERAARRRAAEGDPGR
jgi:hypothetical protein